MSWTSIFILNLKDTCAMLWIRRLTFVTKKKKSTFLIVIKRIPFMRQWWISGWNWRNLGWNILARYWIVRFLSKFGSFSDLSFFFDCIQYLIHLPYKFWFWTQFFKHVFWRTILLVKRIMTILRSPSPIQVRKRGEGWGSK